MYRRNIRQRILEALADTPVVFIEGPRQSGKTTLARLVAKEDHPARYLTFDDASVLAAAASDPAGFLAGLEGPVVLDEVQRVPEMFPAIKALVDRDRTPGRFLLTGSADVLLLPRVSESLAGRMEVLTLWPLSQGEIEGVEERFIDIAFGKNLRRSAPETEEGPDLWDRVLRGGYPESLRRKAERRRGAWFASYVTTILQRDIRDMARIEGLAALPRLLSLVAARSSSLLNVSDLSRDTGIPKTTLKRYMALLEASFLVQAIPAWSGNLSGRLVRSPKVLVTDTALAGHLTGLTRERLEREPTLRGALLESFVAMELRKQQGWSTTRTSLLHFRTHGGTEVDLVLEDGAGRMVAVEVKAAATVRIEDLKGLKRLSELRPRRFHRGILLYAGREIVPFAANLHAVPLSCLWTLGAAGGKAR